MLLQRLSLILLLMGGFMSVSTQLVSAAPATSTSPMTESPTTADSPPIQIGWSEIDITPPRQPVYLIGQHYLRVSEGVLSPLKATVCVLDSGEDHVVWIACDLISISPWLYEQTRQQLAQRLPNVDPHKVILHATHTHAAPDHRSTHPMFPSQREQVPTTTNTTTDATAEYPVSHLPGTSIAPEIVELFNFDIGMNGWEYSQWLSEQLALAVQQAWDNRQPGAIAFGLDSAVIGRNRRWVNNQGISSMYGLRSSRDKESFLHIEGYEDHSLNLIATYNARKELTGIIVNIPSPSQEMEHAFLISADFWHQARAEIRERFGKDLYVLPQCSAAGDITSRIMFETEAHQRMLKLRNHSQLEEMANRISDAVGRILPAIQDTADDNPILIHRAEIIDIPANMITQAQYEENLNDAQKLLNQFLEDANKLLQNPESTQAPRWYVDASRSWIRMAWHLRVADRYEQQKTSSTIPVEVHTIRLGDVAFATNPFEYYLDFGIQLKVRSPAIQTFLVQLAGGGTYVPSQRSVQGGGYGSVPASNTVGPEGGQILADYTIGSLNEMFP